MSKLVGMLWSQQFSRRKLKPQIVTGMEYGCQDGNRVICSINMSTQLLYDYMHSPVDHTQGLE